MNKYAAIVFCVLLGLGGCLAAKPTSSQYALLEEISNLSNQHDLRIAMAAIAIQEMAIGSPGFYKERLSSHERHSPEIFESRTADGRNYWLVIFREAATPSSAAFVIFQQCVGGGFIRERGFAIKVDDLIVRPFNEYARAPENSTLDYYEDDACAQFPGADW